MTICFDYFLERGFGDNFRVADQSEPHLSRPRRRFHTPEISELRKTAGTLEIHQYDDLR
jgi:hypothetical protein